MAKVFVDPQHTTEPILIPDEPAEQAVKDIPASEELQPLVELEPMSYIQSEPEQAPPVELPSAELAPVLETLAENQQKLETPVLEKLQVISKTQCVVPVTAEPKILVGDYSEPVVIVGHPQITLAEAERVSEHSAEQQTPFPEETQPVVPEPTVEKELFVEPPPIKVNPCDLNKVEVSEVFQCCPAASDLGIRLSTDDPGVGGSLSTAENERLRRDLVESLKPHPTLI